MVRWRKPTEKQAAWLNKKFMAGCTDRRTFILTIVAKEGFTVRDLRWVLKKLLRRHNLRCVRIREAECGSSRSS